MLKDDRVEVRVGERDERRLQPAQMEHEGLNVVCMDDIEAGLSKGEVFISPLEVIKQQDLVRGYSVGRGTRDWSKVVKRDGRSGVRGNSGEGVREEEGSELDDGAVYGNVLLSSSSNSRLLSTSSGKLVVCKSSVVSCVGLIDGCVSCEH